MSNFQPTPASTAVAPNDSLVAACDMLVLRALELVGKRTLRATRARRSEANEIPFTEAHCFYAVDRTDLDKALAGAWVHVPLMSMSWACCGWDAALLEGALDRYVRDLIHARMKHEVDNLRFVLRQFTG